MVSFFLFPDFVTKIKNPAILTTRFTGFKIHPSLHYFVGSLHMRMRGYYWHLQLKIIFYTQVCITWPLFLDILAVRFLIVIIYLPLPFGKGYRLRRGTVCPLYVLTRKKKKNDGTSKEHRS